MIQVAEMFFSPTNWIIQRRNVGRKATKKTEEKRKNGKRRSKQKSCTHRSDMFTNWFIMWQSALMSGFFGGTKKEGHIIY